MPYICYVSQLNDIIKVKETFSKPVLETVGLRSLFLNEFNLKVLNTLKISEEQTAASDKKVQGVNMVTKWVIMIPQISI